MPILFFSSLSFLPGTDPELWRTHRSNVLSAVVSYYLYVRVSFFLTLSFGADRFFLIETWLKTKVYAFCCICICSWHLASFFLLILPCKVLIECAFIVGSLALSLLPSNVNSPCSVGRKGPSLPQTGTAGTRSPTTYQANDQAYCTAGSREQTHAKVGWKSYNYFI